MILTTSGDRGGFAKVLDRLLQMEEILKTSHVVKSIDDSSIGRAMGTPEPSNEAEDSIGTRGIDAQSGTRLAWPLTSKRNLPRPGEAALGFLNAMSLDTKAFRRGASNTEGDVEQSVSDPGMKSALVRDHQRNMRQKYVDNALLCLGHLDIEVRGPDITLLQALSCATQLLQELGHMKRCWQLNMIAFQVCSLMHTKDLTNTLLQEELREVQPISVR
ncbi:hypothetical protein B0T10DRAFT_565367 [Thelonectria olida]|uniref:Uncharacterized protein n=1 Tax=Thelonectria olida TaxID=1576542 RepID=A0A9P8VZ74_9HYPO|nr:hypothetical protein B0T10DRAFT_565367 [Thelonectria olida]